MKTKVDQPRNQGEAERGGVGGGEGGAVRGEERFHLRVENQKGSEWKHTESEF